MLNVWPNLCRSCFLSAETNTLIQYSKNHIININDVDRSGTLLHYILLVPWGSTWYYRSTSASIILASNCFTTLAFGSFPSIQFDTSFTNISKSFSLPKETF